jgi:outer membrane protein OmpA-like peptidoglycan-associated protein
MVSHLAGANRDILNRANKNSSHFILAKILCFRKLCRVQSAHSASLRSVSFKKFKKRIARNAKKGEYKYLHRDSTTARKQPVREAIPVVDTVNTSPFPILKADSLIVLGAELLFETNKSTLRSDHFAALDPIVDYLILHPERFVKISGHSDNTGSRTHNFTLSKKRADVVAEYLVNNGVDIDRVETVGLGSEKPLVENATEEGRMKNRRVELLIHSGQ